MSRDDGALNLAGAFVDACNPRVANMALDGELAHVAVCSVDLQRTVAYAVRGLRREELGHSCFAAERVPITFALGGHETQELGGIDLGLAVGQEPLDRLEIGDRATELVTFARVE